jgi:DnaJ homolog subfamily C member 8
MSAQESPSTSSSNTPVPAISDAELEKLLSREASAFQRELEVERILKAFKLKYALLHNDFFICL